ncbi:MAG: transposase [Sphingobacteriales bacterium]|nr:MAG: transposase [Sphingobacteriales bacterium]
MATRYRFAENHIPHFVTFSTVQWIDALSRPLYKDIIVDALKYSISNKGLKLHAWVIMNNHVHLIISSDTTDLADIMRDIKKFTSVQLIKTIKENSSESRKSWMLWLFEQAGKQNANNTNYQFWQQDNHPVALNDERIYRQKLDYLHDNPVRAGIVFEPQQYVYSSAGDYYTNQQGLISLELL